MKTFKFEADLRNFAAKIGLEYGAVVATVVDTLDGKIVRRTPVDTGWARMNWNVSRNTPDLSFSPLVRPEDSPISPDEATRISQARMLAWIGSIQIDPYHTFYIANGIPYIELLENGHSQRQAPNGMVAVSLAEVEAGII